ncbi:polyphosphate polymerase domain-containing protein [Parvicella tangerina]|nr:polyphosphate polymerase domain-containing protein [Parvicella tangerina]
MTTLTDILASFQPISLKDMDSVQLMNRIDTKFILSITELMPLLNELSSHYQILEIRGLRTARYRSLYFDTPDYKHYMHHHNGHPNRYKIRIRRYVDSDLCFLEVKHKKKGRTDKNRIRIEDFELDLSERSINFIKEIVPEIKTLSPTLWNSFERITLVSPELQERVTLDLGLHFKEDLHSQKDIGYDDIVIAEVKQERVNRNSPIMRMLKENNIRKARVSKYCIGMGLINPAIKKNRFKQKYRMIEKVREQ